MKSNRKDIQLLVPDIERDALFAHSWFTQPEGRVTLLSMGNTESGIEESTIKGEKDTIREFLNLEKTGKQITRMITIDNKTIGAVWIELFENHGIKPPSIHIMIGDPEYRGKGIGRSVMEAAIKYIRDDLGYKTIYTRHLTSNVPISKLNESLGFEMDGDSYTDDNGLVWQNIKLSF